MATFGIIIDVFVVLAFVIFGILGFKKGFLHSVLSLFSWIVCLGLAVWLAKYVAVWINGIYDFSGLIGGKIAKGLAKSNAFYAQAINMFETKEALIAALPKDNKFIAQIAEAVFSNSKVNMTSNATIGSVLGSNLGHVCMIVISGILVFIVLKVAVFLLGKLFKNIEQTTVLGGLNKILGLILGLLKAGIIIVAINCLLVAFTLIPAANKVITPTINRYTHVEKVIYKETDKLFGRYVIEGDTVKNWIEKSWQNRQA